MKEAHILNPTENEIIQIKKDISKEKKNMIDRAIMQTEISASSQSVSSYKSQIQLKNQET